ncbi:MAG TPA: YncE family protein [Chloroflexota bacterium]|nr:YncE family protein [Chloroflexota bacterium]
MAHRHTVVGLVLLVTVGVLAGVVVRGASAGSRVRTIAVGRNPLAVALDERIGRAFVLNNAGNSVSMLDTATGTLLSTLATGRDPLALAVDERTGHVFVANNDLGLQDQLSLALNCCPRGKGSVTVLDARSGAIQRTVRVGLSPLAIAVDERVGRAFVVTYGSDSRTGRLSVLDTHSGTVVRTVTVGLLPQGVALDERTGRVFVAGEDSSGLGDVSVLDVMSGRLVRSVTVGQAPGPIAVDQRTGRAFVINQNSDSVSVLDTHSGALVHTTNLGGDLFDLAVDEQTGRVFVANGNNVQVNGRPSMLDGSVSILDATSGRLVRSVSVGMLPTAVAVDARSGRVFVANKGPVDGNLVPLGNGAVTVLDARSGAVLRTVGVGTYPTAIAVDERAGRAFVVNASGTTVRTSQGWWEPAVQWLQPARLPWLPPLAPPSLIHSVTGSVSMLDASR